jgi:hypothetical protein
METPARRNRAGVSGMRGHIAAVPGPRRPHHVRGPRPVPYNTCYAILSVYRVPRVSR